MTRPSLEPDAAGYLPNGRPTAERLAAEVTERLDRVERLPAQLAEIRGWATNQRGNVKVTVNSLGELVDVDLAEAVMTADPRALAAEILRLHGEAHRAATAAAIDRLAPEIGDDAVLDMARAAGLGDRIEPDAPVVTQPGDEPLHPVSPVPAARPRADWQQQPDDEDLSGLDFNQFRSDR